MSLETIFLRTILAQTFIFGLIIIWGAYVQFSGSRMLFSAAPTDVGGLLFLLFSIAYFVALYFLYRFRKLGKQMFLPLVGIFIILGFFTELLNPNQFSKDIFYFFIFFIVSPVFFVTQGFLISLIYFTDLKGKFSERFF